MRCGKKDLGRSYGKLLSLSSNNPRNASLCSQIWHFIYDLSCQYSLLSFMDQLGMDDSSHADELNNFLGKYCSP